MDVDARVRLTPQTRIYFEKKRRFPKCVDLLRQYHATKRVRADFGEMVAAIRELRDHALDDLFYEIDLTIAKRFLNAQPHERIVIQTSLKSFSSPICSMVFESVID